MQNVRTRTLSFPADSGEATSREFVVPYQGRLNRLHVKQLDGTLAGFVVRIYDRADACASASVDSSNPDDQYAHEYSAAHLVLGPLTVAAAHADVTQEQLWVFYENRDELPDNNLRRNAIYIEIEPAGTGTKNFFVTMTTVRDN